MHRMATQKRRVIYLSDVEWEVARRGAEANETTISAYVGLLIRGAATPAMRVAVGVAHAIEATMPDVPVHLGPPRGFAEFRPAPKPTKGK